MIRFTKENIYFFWLVLLLFAPPFHSTYRSFRIDNILILLLFIVNFRKYFVYSAKNYTALNKGLLWCFSLVGITIAINSFRPEAQIGAKTFINFYGFLRWWMVFVFSIYSIRSDEFADKVLKYVMYGFIFHALLGIVGFFKGSSIYNPVMLIYQNRFLALHSNIRSVGAMGLVHDLSNFMAVALCVSVFLLFFRIAREKLSRSFLICIAASSFIALVLTFSKGAFLSVIIFFLFILAKINIGKKIKFFIIATLLAAGVLLFTYWLAPTESFGNYLRQVVTLKRTQTESIFDERIQNYQRSLESFKEHPVIGYGPEYPRIFFIGDGFYAGHLYFYGSIGGIGYLLYVLIFWRWFNRVRGINIRLKHYNEALWAFFGQALLVLCLALNFARAAYTERTLELVFVLFALFAFNSTRYVRARTEPHQVINNREVI